MHFNYGKVNPQILLFNFIVFFINLRFCLFAFCERVYFIFIFLLVFHSINFLAVSGSVACYLFYICWCVCVVAVYVCVCDFDKLFLIHEAIRFLG